MKNKILEMKNFPTILGLTFAVIVIAIMFGAFLKTTEETFYLKEVKIDKDTYDTLNNFMNTSKRVIKDMPRNQALFKELTDYTQSYKDLENEKKYSV